jgi:O-succinylbenzoic acid--CoA ligase
VPAATPGRLLALALPPGAEFAAALDDAWQRGDAVLPIDPRAPRQVRDRLVAAMRPDAPIDPGAALVITTSGSTGEPKGAVLTHAALEASARATMARIGVEPGDRWLSCLPWQHIGGLQVLLRARLFGTPIVIHDRFDVDRFGAERDVSLVSLVPTQLARLLDSGVDLTRFRAILLGGAAAPPGLVERARAVDAVVVTTYGMSETAGGCVYDGVPLDGVDVQVERSGRVLIRGPMLMTGYRLRPDLSEEAVVDGWLRTSDLGRWDGRRLVVHGRVDDVIVCGGEKVVAGAVAMVLVDHPAVREAAVVGVPDEEWGQRVVAVVVPAADPPTLQALRDWVGERAGAANAPTRLVVVDEMPRLPSGKLDRLAAQTLAAQALAAQALPATAGGVRRRPDAR